MSRCMRRAFGEKLHKSSGSLSRDIISLRPFGNTLGSPSGVTSLYLFEYRCISGLQGSTF